MSKMTAREERIVANLIKLTDIAFRSASVGAEMTEVCMNLLIDEAATEDVILAARDGYERAGHDLPSGFESNIKRVAAAGTKYAKRIKETGLALNNRILAALDVPKASTKGRKTKPETKATETKAKPTPEFRGDTVEGARAMINALKAGMMKVVSPAAVNEYENGLTTCLALLSVK